MRTYTVTFSDEEFAQVRLALEERVAGLDARREAINAGGFDATDTLVSIYAAGSALRRARTAEPNSDALSRMLTAEKGPRR